MTIPLQTKTLVRQKPKYTIKNHFNLRPSARNFSTYPNHPLMPLINVHAGVSSKDIDLNSGLSLHHNPYFVHASSEGSGVPAHMRRLI